MPRGFVRAIYTADDGSRWMLQVDADEAEDAARGWEFEGVETLYPLPRGWLPRRVVGIDTTGRQQSARIANTAAALWTGAVSDFTVEATDGTLAVATVVTLQGEQRINFTFGAT